MPENDASTGFSHTASWIERARRMVELHAEAHSFIQRASERYPASFGHIQILLRLWVEAENLDSLILPLLTELNTELMDGAGMLDTFRGLSIQPAAFSFASDVESEEVVYECVWSLSYESSRGVSVSLSATTDGVFAVKARGSASQHEHRIGFPVAKNAVQDALVSVYVAEAISTR